MSGPWDALAAFGPAQRWILSASGLLAVVTAASREVEDFVSLYGEPPWGP